MKGKEYYKKVTLAQDQTKGQWELNKRKEMALKAEAEKRNATLPEEEKNEWVWVLFGRAEGRRLIKKKRN